MVASTVAAALVGLTAAPAGAQEASFTFTGGGWGHGVGMSQWGAKGRADAGQNVGDILGAYFPGAQISGAGDPGVRVHLTDAASTSLTFTGTATLGGNAGPVRGATNGETVDVRAGAGGGVEIVPAGQPVVALAPGDTQFVTWDTANGNVRVGATGNRYRHGRLVIRVVQPGVLQLVNDNLSMQQYLYGLAEMPSSWGLEALKAQAIAGRTYAQRRVGGSGNYDLESTTIDQVYAGYEKAAGAGGSRWVEAVDSTFGQILTYNGSPIDAFYSSSNGGYGELASYVFINDRPYLQPVVDPFDNTAGNSNFRWTRTYSGAELGQYLRDVRGINVGTVTNVDFSGNFGWSGRIDRATVRLTGTTGTASITGSQLRSMINASNPTLARQLPSTLLFFKPIGSLDTVGFAPGGVRVSGWTAFSGSQQPALAHVYVNGVFKGGFNTGQPRPDVATIVPGATPTTGFDVTVPVDQAQNTVCVYGLTPNGSANTFLGCRDVTVPVQPMGSLDVASPVPGGVRVAGWALDPNTAGSVAVHVYVNGANPRAIDAGRDRADIASVFPAYGAAHGFDEIIPVDRANNTVCAYAINVGPGDNQLLACRNVTVPIDPFGSLDVATGTPDGVFVAGWAIDPDVADPIGVHVYVDGAATPLVADQGRADIAAVFPAYGAPHGFSALIPADPGTHRVCAYGLNVGAGGNSLLSCRNVTVPGDPVGSLDVVSVGAGGVRVAGWAIDPNSSDPIDVHVYVGSAGTPVEASTDRPDLAAAFPTSGTQHGFDVTVPGAAGQQVCVYGINVGPGKNSSLGCRVAR
jgi:SpoIID/LytB domain protein